MTLLSDVLASMFDKTRKRQPNPGAPERIETIPVESVQSNGLYRVKGGAAAYVTGRNPGYQVGDNVRVAVKDGVPQAIIGHTMLKAQFHPTAVHGDVVEEIWVKDGGRLGFRSADEIKEIDLSELIAWTPQAVKWGDNDNTFVVAGGATSKGYTKFAAFEIGRPIEKKTKLLPSIELLSERDITTLALELGPVQFHEDRTHTEVTAVLRFTSPGFGDYSRTYIGYEFNPAIWTDTLVFDEIYTFVVNQLIAGPDVVSSNSGDLLDYFRPHGTYAPRISDFWLDLRNHIIVVFTVDFSGFNFYKRATKIMTIHPAWDFSVSSSTPQPHSYVYQSDDYVVSEKHYFLIDATGSSILYRTWGNSPTIGGERSTSFGALLIHINSAEFGAGYGPAPFNDGVWHYNVPPLPIHGTFDIDLGNHPAFRNKKVWLHDNSAPFTEGYQEYAHNVADMTFSVTAPHEFVLGSVSSWWAFTIHTGDLSFGNVVYSLPLPYETVYWDVYHPRAVEKSKGGDRFIAAIEKNRYRQQRFWNGDLINNGLPPGNIVNVGQWLGVLDIPSVSIGSVPALIRSYDSYVTGIASIRAVTLLRAVVGNYSGTVTWQMSLSDWTIVQLDLSTIDQAEWFIMAPDFYYDREHQDFLRETDEALLAKDDRLDKVDALRTIDPLPSASDIHVVNDPRILRALGRYQALPKAT